MRMVEAVTIFKQIENDKYTEEEKGLAIYKVMNMSTHNGITKTEMLLVLRWMFNKMWEVSDE